jgi:hypothetical protein
VTAREITSELLYLVKEERDMTNPFLCEVNALALALRTAAARQCWRSFNKNSKGSSDQDY